MLRPLLLLVAVTLTASSCGAISRTLVEDDMSTAGAQEFAAPPETVSKAAIGALRTAGFEIAMTSADGLVIKTGRRPVAIEQGVPWSHQWVLQILPNSAGATVQATPHAYWGAEEAHDLSYDYWEARWAELFAEIADNIELLRPAPTPARLPDPV